MPGRSKPKLAISNALSKRKHDLIVDAVDIYAEEVKKPSHLRLGTRKIADKVIAAHKLATGELIHFGHSTILRHYNGGRSLYEFNKSKSLLSEDEKEPVIDFLIQTAERGFPHTHRRLEEVVNAIIRNRLPEFPGVGLRWTSRFLALNSVHASEWKPIGAEAHNMPERGGVAPEPRSILHRVLLVRVVVGHMRLARAITVDAVAVDVTESSPSAARALTLGTSESTQCSWGADDPESRPATKQYIESLRVKIQMLESEIAQLRLAGSNSEQPPSDIGTPTGTSLQPPGSPGGFSQETTTPGIRTSHSNQPTNVEREGRPIAPLPLTERPSMIYRYIFSIDTSIHIDQQTPEVQKSLVCDWNRHLPPLDGVHLSREEHDVLLYRCFMYGSTWLLGLFPDLFLRDLLSSSLSPSAQIQFQHYSPLLHCSLLAFAAAFSDRPEVRARATRDRLAAHAKKWLDEELNSTDPSLAISMALLSEHHRSVGQTSVGYMYLGMCSRATSNLGLMGLEGESSCRLPAPRPPNISPLIAALGGFGTTATESDDASGYKTMIEWFVQNCKLSVIASQATNKTPESRSGAGGTNAQLQAWYDTLPDGQRIRPPHVPTPPHVLCLHLHYWWTILAFGLPWLNATRVLERDLTGEEFNRCAYATSQVLSLVAMFSAQHGLQFLPRTTIQASVSPPQCIIKQMD